MPALRPVMNTIHLTSLLVQVTPGGRATLLNERRLPGLRLHETSAPSKLIALLESAEESAAAEVADRLLAIAGVLTVSIISHLAESASDLEQEVLAAGAHR